MVRGTFVATIDQALISILNFLIAFALVRYGTKNEYGLYSQLVSLQALFSPVVGGLFISAFLAIAPRMAPKRRAEYTANMAQASLLVTLLSALLAATLTYSGARLFGAPLGWATVSALTGALLGLWWREIFRQVCFADLHYRRALCVDLAYIAATGGAISLILRFGEVTAANMLWCTAFGAAVASLAPLILTAFGSLVRIRSMVRDVAMSWQVGRWDTLGALVSWVYLQSYVYFAALHGGLAGAAEISAGKLVAAPLALLWASFANVLRPSGAMAMARGEVTTVRKLAGRSALFVIGSSSVYAVAVVVLLPFAQNAIFAGKFNELHWSAILWILYSMLAGLTTVAASLLRSALKFRQVFTRQVASCFAAMGLLFLSLRFPGVYAQIIALSLVELMYALLLWGQLAKITKDRAHLQPEQETGPSGV
jgi:O-antigen/teichoic acid export membrane protein